MIEDQKLREIRQYAAERPGQRLAGEREIAERFGLSRVHLRKILDVLETEGAVRRRQGSGTFATAPGSHELRGVVLSLDATLKLGDDPFISRAVEILQGELQQVGAQCLIERTPETNGAFRNCDGVVAMGSASVAAAQASAGVSLPAVGLFAGGLRPGPHFGLLELDDRDAGARAARRLLRSKVERVFFVGWRDLPAAGERLLGAETELGPTGIPLQVVDCGMNYAAGLRLGLAFPAFVEEKAGIIAANDWLAVGLHTGLQSAGAGLRQRLQIVAFDGVPLAAQPELGIASLAIPLKTMAADAVAELQRLKKGASGRAIRYALEWATP